MAGANELVLDVRVETSQGNKAIGEVNQNLTEMERRVEVVGKTGSTSLGQFEGAAGRSRKDIREATAAAQFFGSEIGLKLHAPSAARCPRKKARPPAGSISSS